MTGQNADTVAPLRDQLGWEIRLALHRANVTQKELAKRTGLSEKHVCQLLTNQADGSFAVWEDFAAALGLRWRIALTDGKVCDT